LNPGSELSLSLTTNYKTWDNRDVSEELDLTLESNSKASGKAYTSEVDSAGNYCIKEADLKLEGFLPQQPGGGGGGCFIASLVR
jgi:hypothetical protein